MRLVETSVSPLLIIFSVTNDPSACSSKIHSWLKSIINVLHISLYLSVSQRKDVLMGKRTWKTSSSWTPQLSGSSKLCRGRFDAGLLPGLRVVFSRGRTPPGSLWLLLGYSWTIHINQKMLILKYVMIMKSQEMKSKPEFPKKNKWKLLLI